MGDRPSVSFQQFLDQADTGDVVIWQGTSLISLAVEPATFSNFSHATMVVRDPSSGDKYLLQSVTEALAPDPLTKPPRQTHTGVQAGPLAEVMSILYKEGDLPAWRQLKWNWPSSFNTNTWQLAQSKDGTPYPWIGGDNPTPTEIAESVALMTVLWGAGRELNLEVLNPIFCSALVAYVLQQAGVIERTMVPNGYAPKDFSSSYPGNLQPGSGISFNPDVWVTNIPSASDAR
jgi:cell wall-associated NlpC family hydrolase